MPNTTVPANAEGMPAYNRAAIMQKAWEHYRWVRRQYSAKQIERGTVDASFSACLVIAWRIAKQEREEAIKKAKAAALAGTPAGERLRGLQAALADTDRLSFRYSAAARRTAIKSEIALLLA